MARRRSYAFIRREMPNFQQLQAAGWNTPLFAYDDPRLAQQVAAARAAGQEFGIWADPHGMAAEDFARRMAGINQRYNPSVLVPDIEFIGKGYEGSEGWAYNQALARAWQRYLPGASTALTVMPNQRDFNYEAWKDLVGEWLPQAYGADPTKHVFDPKQIAQTLIDRGVDPNLITPVLGPGHGQYWSDYQGNTALWTADDFMARDNLPRYYGTREAAQAAPPDAGERVQRPARLSQSAPMIQEGGLQWFGQNFQDADAFRAALQRRGRSYADWARQHPTAAAALGARQPVKKRPTTRAS